MSLLTLSDLLAAYKTVSPDKEWALGGLEDANKFANAIEAAVIKRLTTVSVEPAYSMEFKSGKLEYSTREQLAAARVQSLEEAEVAVRKAIGDCDLGWAAQKAIRALLSPHI